MLLKTPVSTTWAHAPLTRRLLNPPSLLAGFLLGASSLGWAYPALCAADERTRILLWLSGPVLLFAAGLRALSHASARATALRLAEESTQELAEARQADMALRTTVARHQAVLESLSGGFVILDAFDRYVHVSPGVTKVLGSEGLRLGSRLYQDLPA